MLVATYTCINFISIFLFEKKLLWEYGNSSCYLVLFDFMKLGAFSTCL